MQAILYLMWLVGIVVFVLSVAMIANVLKNRKLNDVTKALWVVAIIFLYPIGAAAYFFAAGLYKHQA